MVGLGDDKMDVLDLAPGLMDTSRPLSQVSPKDTFKRPRPLESAGAREYQWAKVICACSSESAHVSPPQDTFIRFDKSLGTRKLPALELYCRGEYFVRAFEASLRLPSVWTADISSRIINATSVPTD